MPINPILTDSSGNILTDSSGAILTGSLPLSNDDIQFFDWSVNLMKALLWQYNEAEALQSILQQKQDWYNVNHQQFWFNWVYDVFNLPTANDFGCNVWSIILGLPLFVNIPPDPDKPTFGFDLAEYGNFDNSNFTDTNGTLFLLPLALKRIALQLRYFQLTTSGTVPEINRFMKFLFGSMGSVYLEDGHDMTQTYIFNFPVTADLAFVLNNLDILPRPAGVGSSWIDATEPFFGFDSAHPNFDNGIVQ